MEMEIEVYCPDESTRFFFGFYQQTSVICSFNVQISPEMRCKKPGWGHGVLSPKSVPPCGFNGRARFEAGKPLEIQPWGPWGSL